MQSMNFFELRERGVGLDKLFMSAEVLLDLPNFGSEAFPIGYEQLLPNYASLAAYWKTEQESTLLTPPAEVLEGYYMKP